MSGDGHLGTESSSSFYLGMMTRERVTLASAGLSCMNCSSRNLFLKKVHHVYSEFEPTKPFCVWRCCASCLPLLLCHHTVSFNVTCSYGSAELCRDHCQYLVSILCHLQGSSLVPGYRHLVVLLCRLLPKMSADHQVSEL